MHTSLLPVFHSLTHDRSFAQCSVLLLRGANSDMLTEACAKTMADPELNQGKRSVDLVTLDGPGHAPSLMSIDQIFVVIDWLRRH